MPVSIPDTEIHPLRSDAIGDDFELWIAHPQPGFQPSPEPPGVLYVLDANLFFGTAVEMTRLMHKLYAELPPIRVVGLAYPGPDFFRQGQLRSRDFTPTEDPGMAAMAKSLPAPPTGGPVTPAMGGAGAFLDFLADDVLPFVSSRFDAAGRSTLFGSSMGGLFAVHVLLERPELFDGYVGVSPALWWNDAQLLHDVPPPPEGVDAPKVYLASGSLEEAAHVPMLARFKLISNARAMAERLVGAGWPAATTTFTEIDGETHTSVVAPALARGLRAMHPRRPAPAPSP